MKTLKDVLTEYTSGLIIWGLIFFTVCLIAYESQRIIQSSALVMPILKGFVCVTLVIFAPLGITYVAKSIKETTPDNQISKMQYVPKRFQ